MEHTAGHLQPIWKLHGDQSRLRFVVHQQMVKPHNGEHSSSLSSWEQIRIILCLQVCMPAPDRQQAHASIFWLRSFAECPEGYDFFETKSAIVLDYLQLLQALAFSCRNKSCMALAVPTLAGNTLFLYFFCGSKAVAQSGNELTKRPRKMARPTLQNETSRMMAIHHALKAGPLAVEASVVGKIVANDALTDIMPL